MLLEASGIQKSFDGVKALTSVSVELRAGEVHALLGENGAGKSTLIKVLTGAVQPDGGEVRREIRPVEADRSFRASRRPELRVAGDQEPDGARDVPRGVERPQVVTPAGRDRIGCSEP